MDVRRSFEPPLRFQQSLSTSRNPQGEEGGEVGGHPHRQQTAPESPCKTVPHQRSRGTRSSASAASHDPCPPGNDRVADLAVHARIAQGTPPPLGPSRADLRSSLRPGNHRPVCTRKQAKLRSARDQHRHRGSSRLPWYWYRATQPSRHREGQPYVRCLSDLSLFSAGTDPTFALFLVTHRAVTMQMKETGQHPRQRLLVTHSIVDDICLALTTLVQS